MHNCSDFDLDEFMIQLSKCKEDNKDKLCKEKLVKISPDSYIYYNSCNLFCGKQYSGKSWSAMVEIAKISQISPETHLIIVIVKDENKSDKTVEVLRPLVKCPLIYIHESDAEEFMKNFLKYKRFYNKVKENNWENKIEDEQVKEVFQNLYINNFNRKWLHTLILFNDIASSKLFKKSENYFPQIVALGRHTQCSSFLCSQYWKGINTEIKANLACAVIFGLFYPQQINYIFQQIPTNYTIQEIKEVYKNLGNHDKMIIDCQTGDVFIDNSISFHKNDKNI